MRSSARTKILEATFAVANRSGIPSITLEEAAREAGLTKAGVIYHFKTKRELLEAAVDYLTESWEQAMLSALSGPFEQADPEQRTRAYLAVAADPAFTRGDFLAVCNAFNDPEITKPWSVMTAKWFGDGGDGEELRLKVARFAADGLWFAKTTGGAAAPTGEEYRDLVAAIARLAQGGG